MFAIHGEALLNNGYQPVPIKPGSKAPMYPNWSKEIGLGPVHQHIQQHPDWGVGISNIHAVDADIPDKPIALAIAAAIAKIDPGYSLRVGQAPRFLVPVNKNSDICNSSTVWYDPSLYIEGGSSAQNRSSKNQIEFLRAGSKQFVAYAIHPETNKEYKWYYHSPLDTHADSLREWSAEDVRSLYVLFDSLCEARGFTKGSVKNDSRIFDNKLPSIPDYVKAAGPGTMGNDFQSAHDPTTLQTLTDLIYALPKDKYLNTDYKTWNEVGMAIHSATEGSEEGYLLFDTWSATGDTYEGKESVAEGNGVDNCTRTKWNSYTLKSAGQGLGIGSIYHWLQEAGVDIPRDDTPKIVGFEDGEPVEATLEMTMDAATKRFMYLEETNEIGDFEALTVIPYSNKKRSLAKFDSLIPGRSQTKSFLDTWTKHPASLVGQREWFRPMPDTPIIYDNGLSYFNSYRAPNIPKVVYDPAVIKPVLDHIKFIIPECVLFEAFLDWVAHKWRYPWLKSFVFLIITSSHQTGKGVLLELLKNIFGHNHVLHAPPSTFTEKASQFNEFLAGSIFNFCDEAKFDAAAYDKLKSWVYASSLQVNKKNGFKGTMETFSSWLIFSNHLNSAVIGPEDVRLAVSIMRDIRKPSSYYEGLFKLINDPAKNVTAHFVAMLEARDISKFKRHDAPWSDAKGAMVRSSKNDLEYLISSMIDDAIGPCKYDITSARLVAFYIEEQVGGLKSSLKKISEILERITASTHLDKYYVVVEPMKAEGNPLINSKEQRGLLCLRNYDKWKSAGNAQLKLEYLRSREAAFAPSKLKEDIDAMQFNDLKEA